MSRKTETHEMTSSAIGDVLSTGVVACVLSALLLLGAACSQEPGKGGLVVETSFETLEDVGLKKVRTIGGPDSEALLGKPVDVAVGEDGRVFVVDQSYSKVYVFSPDGNRITELGREGRGPGEFMHPASVEVGPHDSLYVSAGHTSRVSVFSPGPDRTFQYAYVVESQATRTPGDVYPTGTGHALALYSKPYGPAPGNPGKWLARVNGVGEVIEDSLAFRPLLDAYVSEPEPGRVRTVIRPFGRRSVFESHPSGAVCHAWTGHTAIVCTGPRGSQDTVLTLPHRPLRVREADRDAIRESWPEQSLSVIEANAWHNTYPVFSGMAVGTDRTIWIRGVTRKAKDKPSVPVYGIDAEAESVVLDSLPSEERIAAASDDFIYTTRFPSSPKIVVYEITGS